MNAICGQGDALFISLELLQDITQVKCRKHLVALLCLTQEEAREEMNINLQPNPVPIALPPGWCSCPWQCRACVQPGDSTRCPQGKVASLQSCFLALPSLHGVILGICKLSFFKGSLKKFFQTALTSSAVSKSEAQSSWAVKSEALELPEYG